LTGQVLLPSPGRVGWSWIEDFLALTHPSITHNLLAWVVAASRRPEVRDFPLLFIGGSSGTGKSTLAKLLLQLGSSRIEAPLGSITPYILMQTLSSTTSIPIFIDEWTRLSRKDTLEAFQGLIPTIYEGGSAHRGQSDLSSITYRLTAPVITAGEDTMTLDREMDRAVRVSLSKHYQNPHSLTSLERVPFHRIGAEIHAFVTSGLDLPPLVTGDPKTRPDYNTEILRGGWRTLLAMLEAAHDRGDDVPSLPAEPDSLTEAPSYDPVADQENIYVTALQEAVTLRDSSGLAVVWPDEAGRGTWVRFMPLTALVEKSLNIQLPGKSRAFEAHFANEYKIISDRATPPLSMMTVRAKLIVGLHLDAD
jgi:hypothetical protein